MNFHDILTRQQEFFTSQKTKNLKFRKIYLEKFKETEAYKIINDLYN